MERAGIGGENYELAIDTQEELAEHRYLPTISKDTLVQGRAVLAMKRLDWCLVVIASAKGDQLTPVQLQKCVFLVNESLNEMMSDKHYNFVPFDYGPFDIGVYEDAEQLERMGLVTILRADSGGWKVYSATRGGLDSAAELRKRIPPVVVNYIDGLVAWARRLSFQQLVRAIYESYPQYRANSVFQF